MALISRESLYRHMHEFTQGAQQYGITPNWTAAISLIGDEPEASPEPVVCCAECKWWNPPTVGVTGKCAALKIHITGDFYCKNGTSK